MSIIIFLKHLSGKTLYRCISYLLFLVIFQITILCLTAHTGYSAQVTASWDPNSGATLAGYKIYYGTQSRSYSFSKDVGNQTSCIITGLAAGTKYFFAVTAYDTNRYESNYSVEVTYTTPAAVTTTTSVRPPTTTTSVRPTTTTTSVRPTTTTTSVRPTTTTTSIKPSTTTTSVRTTSTTTSIRPTTTTSSVRPTTTTSQPASDADGDGILNVDDNCLSKPNGYALGTCSPWSGSPGVVCESDNDCTATCTGVRACNMNQEDADNDGVGDVCDNCLNKPNGYALGTCSPWSGSPGVVCESDNDCTATCTGVRACNMNQEDTDHDGFGDGCDNCPNNCNTRQKDADSDGRGDVCDTTPGCGGCSGIGCEQQC